MTDGWRRDNKGYGMKKEDKKKKRFWARLGKDIRVNYILYLMLVPVTVYFVLFCYIPMTGVQMAFKSYQIKAGIWGSP